MKTIAKKLTTTMLATVVILGSTLPGISKIKAAEEEAIPPQIEMTLEEKQAAFPNLYAEDENEPWYIKELRHIGVYVINGVCDKLVNTALDQIFGEQDKSEEIKSKLKGINGKLDQIQSMLKQLMEQMTVSQARESIEQKLKLYGIVESAASVARKGYEAPMLKYVNPTLDQVKKDRWPVLQEWKKLRIENSTDCFSSFHYLCELVSNSKGLNWEGDYLKQYEAYGKMVYHWDQQMVDFTEDQVSRDFYYLAEMAAMNSLYLEYAKENGVKMDYNGYRRIMAKDIDSIIAKFKDTKLRTVDKEYVKLMDKDRVLLTVKREYGVAYGETFANHIKNDIYDGHLIYATQDQFKNDVENKAGYHMMTNDERELLLGYADKGNRTLYDELKNGGVHLDVDGKISSPYLITAYNKGDRNYYHYGDANFGYRSVYIENYDMSKVGKGGGQDTHIANASVTHRHDEDFDVVIRRNKSEFNRCLTNEKDDNLKKIIANDYINLWVKDSNSSEGE